MYLQVSLHSENQCILLYFGYSWLTYANPFHSLFVKSDSTEHNTGSSASPIAPFECMVDPSFVGYASFTSLLTHLL
jgi:hypothetical protein